MQRQSPDVGSNVWSSGSFDGRADRRKLLFGHMYEDPLIELEAFAPRCRVFCIASAGCTAIDLAKNGHSVTAVDINPAQISYLRGRLGGQPSLQGSAERLMAFGRRFFFFFGWRKSQLERFLHCENVDEQIRFWTSELDTWTWRRCIDTMVRPAFLGRVYASDFVRGVPVDFGKVIRKRLERGWSSHPNAVNPYARALLLGTWPDSNGDLAVEIGAGSITTETGDAAEFLEGCEPGSFDAFSLSNILDGVSIHYRQRVLAAVNRAGSPDSIMVLRTFAEPQDANEAEYARRDRSMLWGGISVVRTRSIGL